AKQTIEFEQLAAFAFIAHPASFGLVEAPFSMKKGKPVTLASSMPSVQSLNLLQSEFEKFFVCGLTLNRTVHEVGQQGKMKMRIGIGQIMELQTFDQRPHIV